jgi:hypothetical protein
MKPKEVIPLSSVILTMIGTPVHATPVAHYKLDETSGTTLADSSGNGFDATVVNPQGTGDLDVAGVAGSAYRPGANGNDYGLRSTGTADFGITGNNARTVAFWFNTSSFGGTTSQYRLLGIGIGAAAESFDIVAESGTNAGGANRVGLRYGNGNVYYDADNSGTAFAINTWYHVAMVYDGTTLDLEAIGTAADGNGLQVYVNGVQMNAAGGNLNNSTQALSTGAGNFSVGIRNDLSQYGDYPGLLDDLQIYDESLSSAQVLSLYNNPGSVIPEPAVFSLAGLAFLLSMTRRRR